MTPKKVTVKIGEPVATLPNNGRRTTPPAKHWLKVAQAARCHEGQWLPVQIGHLTVDRHRQAPGDIKRGKIAAFADGGYDAAYRDGTLYVRYNAPATLEAVTA